MGDVDAPITLLSRRGCHLCEDARESVARVGRIAGVEWVERDVDADDELRYDYGDRVPVVLLHGREHGFWRVDEARLLADLRATFDA